MIPGFFIPPPDQTIGNSSYMRQVLDGLGLSGNLKLLLDAGDSGSVASGSQTTWNDVSGNGRNFYRGADGSSGSDDPTFNGTVGKGSSSEFWSFDGGDSFTGVSAPDTLVSSWHKDGALFTLCGWGYVASTGPNLVSTGNPGIRISLSTTLPSIFRGVLNGSGEQSAGSGAFSASASNRWNMWGFTINESAGSGLYYLNGQAIAHTRTYGIPSSSAATSFKIGSDAFGTLAPASTRIASLAAFSTALTETQLDQIFDATRGKFGV